MSFPRYPAYKDSGVEWVGEVPAHWTVMPLKRDIEFVTSGARGWAENYADDGDLFLRIGNLTRDSIRLDLSDIQRVVAPEGAEVDRTQVQAGDILFSITAYLGSVAVVPEALGRAFVSQHVALVRLGKKHITSEWSAYVAISNVGKTHLETTGYGGTKVQLSLADVVSLPMVVPPIDEQVLLVRFLDHETAKIDALVDGVFRLREDDSLISEADYVELCRPFRPEPEDVLLAIVGATLGKTAVIPPGLGDFHIQRSLAIFRANRQTTSQWLHLVFQSGGFQALLWEYVGYSAQPGIYLGTLCDFRVPVPPIEEQRRIVAEVACKLEHFHSLVAEAEEAVKLLQERRTALISAAVTGQIDVRGKVPLEASA